MKKIIIGLCLISVLVPTAVFSAVEGSGGAGGSGQGGAGGSGQGGAGGSSQPVDLSIPNPLGDIESLSDLFYLVINFVLSFSYAIIAFFLIWSGFKFVTAQGSEEKLTDAKNTFKYTIIGAILVIGAQVIVEVTKDIFTQIAS